MKLRFHICVGIHPQTWADIQSATGAMVPDILDEAAKYGVFPNEDALHMECAEEETKFWEASAAALGLDDSSFQQYAASNRVTWREEDRPTLNPRIQCRLDGKEWNFIK